MIGWIYSVAGARSGVRRDYQKFLETTKTVVDASNRPRIVTNVLCDDFMQLERPWDVEPVPAPAARLAAPPRVAWTAIEQRDTSSILICF